ncbi:MAG: hypothetical protein LBC47_09065 [Tannerella sp.]|nr:hypothetical protein [Tannerella sp.]
MDNPVQAEGAARGKKDASTSTGTPYGVQPVHNVSDTLNVPNISVIYIQPLTGLRVRVVASCPELRFACTGLSGLKSFGLAVCQTEYRLKKNSISKKELTVTTGAILTESLSGIEGFHARSMDLDSLSEDLGSPSEDLGSLSEERDASGEILPFIFISCGFLSYTLNNFKIIQMKQSMIF